MSMAKIRHLERQAAEIADRINKRLEAGDRASSLIEDLTKQVEVVNALQTEIKALVDKGDPTLDAESLQRLKTTFKDLTDRVEANVKTAGRKGVRITPPVRQRTP